MTAPPSIDSRAFLERQWPGVAAKLGDRLEAFLQLVAERAAQHQLSTDAAAARFANLCFAFGAAFESKPENEWALAILLDERLSPWVKLHQLVHRGQAELRRRGSDGAALAEQLRTTDTRVIDALEAPTVDPLYFLIRELCLYHQQ